MHFLDCAWLLRTFLAPLRPSAPEPWITLWAPQNQDVISSGPLAARWRTEAMWAARCAGVFLWAFRAESAVCLSMPWSASVGTDGCDVDTLSPRVGVGPEGSARRTPGVFAFCIWAMRSPSSCRAKATISAASAAPCSPRRCARANRRAALAMSWIFFTSASDVHAASCFTALARGGQRSVVHRSKIFGQWVILSPSLEAARQLAPRIQRRYREGPSAQLPRMEKIQIPSHADTLRRWDPVVKRSPSRLLRSTGPATH